MFEVVGLEVEAVRLKLERGDVGFVAVWVGVGCKVFFCAMFEVCKPKRLVIDGVAVEVVVGMVVDIGVGFAGESDLDDSLDPRDVRVDLEVRGKEYEGTEVLVVRFMDVF